MTRSSLRTPLLLLLLAAIVGGASFYTTDVLQAKEAAELRDSRRIAELSTKRAEDLIIEEATSAEAAEAALSRWYSRYKYIPREMDTADIVEYLEVLTRRGFDAFDLRLVGQTTTPDYSKYTFDVEGVGEYESLYHLIWHIENNREFYRVHSLRMAYEDALTDEGVRPVSRDLVKFSFQLESFFDGIEGISAPEENLVPIPVGLLLPHSTSRDIFAPMVRVPKDAPATAVSVPAPSETRASTAPAAPAPATSPEAAPAAPKMPEGLDAERSTLSLILGDQALFTDEWDREFRVRVGDAVEGGEIAVISASQGVVHAKVTRDGKERIVVRTLGDRTTSQ